MVIIKYFLHPNFIAKYIIRLVALLLFIGINLTGNVAAQDGSVFILHSYHQEYPWTKEQHQGIIATLQRNLPDHDLAISTEYLDTKRINCTDEYQGFFADYLKKSSTTLTRT